jgi:hypothetical protein
MMNARGLSSRPSWRIVLATTLILTLGWVSSASSATRDLTADELEEMRKLIVGNKEQCPTAVRGTVTTHSDTESTTAVDCGGFRYEVDMKIYFPSPYPETCPPKDQILEPETPPPAKEKEDETKKSAEPKKDPAPKEVEDIPAQCLPTFVVTIRPLKVP